MKSFAAKLLLNVCIAFVVVPLLTASAQNTEEDCDAPAKTMDAFSQKLLDAAKESPVLVAKHDKKVSFTCTSEWCFCSWEMG